MSGIARGRPFLRGGWTAFIGWVLVFVGVLGGAVAAAEASWFDSWVTSTGLSLPENAVLLEWTLLLFSAVTAGVGVMLVGFAIDERRREEKLELEPLNFPPFRRPTWQKAVPVAVVVAIAVVVPGLYVIPASQTFQGQFAVDDCSSAMAFFPVNLPSGAILTYEWRSSDGAPVTEVYAPSGFSTQAEGPSFEVFYNSSFGYGSVQSNGTSIVFWACNVGSSVPGLQIDITGNYYIFH